MKIYHTTQGIIIQSEDKYYQIFEDWDTYLNDDQIFQHTTDLIKRLEPVTNGHIVIREHLLPPVGKQEIWASGVTYLRSKSARMEESKEAGGGSFYDRVYDAERPELFFKSTAHRAKGHKAEVRIRKDSKWNVPEPELTLVISSSGKIIGYTIGNDMSSRDIEGENPLYLPQAKTYDGSAAVGPCIFITDQPLPSDTSIEMEILRENKQIFSGQITISQIKRQFEELVDYLFRELSFPHGCLLMTGTGIVPPNEFTLEHCDEVRITIPPVGTLSNFVA